jgi:hypothetical protein
MSSAPPLQIFVFVGNEYSINRYASVEPPFHMKTGGERESVPVDDRPRFVPTVHGLPNIAERLPESPLFFHQSVE